MPQVGVFRSELQSQHALYLLGKPVPTFEDELIVVVVVKVDRRRNDPKFGGASKYRVAAEAGSPINVSSSGSLS